MWNALGAALACIAVAGSGHAQKIWRVGGSSSIQSVQVAIERAAPGDVVVVAPTKTYGGFTLRKGLVIRGKFTVAGNRAARRPSDIVVDIPTGEIAHIQGLQFVFGSCGATACGKIDVRGGRVTFEDVELHGAGAATLTVTGAEVTLVRANISARQGPAIDATTSSLTVRDSRVIGSSAGRTGTSSYAPSAAIRQSDGSTHIDGSTIVGGSGRELGFSGAAGLTLSGMAAAWLVSSGVGGGTGSRNHSGGTALVNNGFLRARVSANTKLIGGHPNGKPHAGAVDTNAPLLGVGVEQPFARGRGAALAFSGRPSQPIALLLATASRAARLPALVEQPLWIDAASPLLAIGKTDASGTWSVAFAIPDNPWLEHRAVWFQAISGTQLPLQTSAIVGGVIR